MTKQISHSTIIKLLEVFATHIQDNGITLVYENHVLYNVTGFGNSEYYDCSYTEFVDYSDYRQFVRDFIDMSVRRATNNHEMKLITPIINKPDRIRCYECITKNWRKKSYLITYSDVDIINNCTKGTRFDDFGRACIFMACLAELGIV